MTIDQGPDMSRYQGLVALEGGSLEDAAHEYFLRSEQIPTRVRLAVGEEWRGGGEGPKHRWRAGGMLLQFLPKAPERARQPDLHPGDAPEGVVAHTVAEDDAWVEGQSLISTVEDVELIDPDLSGERLLYRLFHERGVRVFQPLPLRAQCSCSREAVSSMLASFASQDRADMVKDGKVVVTCEFCSSVYEFTPQEAGVESAAIAFSSEVDSGSREENASIESAQRCCAPVTRQITSPTSSATSSEPSGPSVTPTGRP